MAEYTIKNSETFDIQQYIHPSTKSRFVLALIGVVPIIMWISWMSFNNPIFLIIMLSYILLISVLLWIGLELVRARLIGNAVKIGPDNFPEISKILKDVTQKIGYSKDVEIYVIEDGSVNMMIYRFFSSKFIVIHSSFVESCESSKDYRDIEWAIARFVGYLKIKKDHYFPVVFEVMESIKKFPFVNLFILPYERCIIYSGDRIGLAICGEMEAAVTGLGKLMIGKTLYGKISSETFISQSRIVNSSIFAAVSRFFSEYPHMTDRYLNIMSFVKDTAPEHYHEFAHRHRIDLRSLENVLNNRHGR
ncbi:MAG: M48 family metallopeptidase [Alphaproteobacteria bacterium]